MTALNRSGKNRLTEKISIFFSLGLFIAFLLLSIEVSIHGSSDRVYVEAHYTYTVLAGIALLLDIKVVVQGGIKGAQRIARHLWRMTLALFIATASLFFGQSQIFPKIIRTDLFLSAPILIVFASLLFWLVKVYISERFRLAKNKARVKA